MSKNQSHFGDATRTPEVTISSVRIEVRNAIAQAYGKILDDVPDDNHTSAIFEAADLYVQGAIAQEFGAVYNEGLDAPLMPAESQKLKDWGEEFTQLSVFPQVFGVQVRRELAKSEGPAYVAPYPSAERC
ncbi:MAG TPA: hypothetical protein DIU06_03340 [Rhodospirillaceae bacterium]|nr:hypothetical protein [Rhodospirillaceae bacterium]|tara:strand:- start:10777 stop:11166 length:390 start_codon:yes stop_codon:yes gene_type:complete